MDRRAMGAAARHALESLSDNREDGARRSSRDTTSRALPTAFPKRHFPAIHRACDDAMPEPSSSHNIEGTRLDIKGTRLGHVRAANADSSGGK